MTREVLILSLLVLGVVTPLLGMRMPSYLRTNGERAVALLALLTAVGLVAYSHKHHQRFPDPPDPMRSRHWEFQPVHDAAARRLLAHVGPLPALDGPTFGGSAPAAWAAREDSGAAECQRVTAVVDADVPASVVEAFGCLGPIAYRRTTPLRFELTPATGTRFVCDGTPAVAVDSASHTYAVRCPSTGAHVVLRETLVERLEPAPADETRAWAAAVARIKAARRDTTRAELFAHVGLVLAFAAWLSSLRSRVIAQRKKTLSSAPYRTEARDDLSAADGPSREELLLTSARHTLAATALVIGFSAPLVGLLVLPPEAVVFTRATRPPSTPLRAVCGHRNDVPHVNDAPAERPLYFGNDMHAHCERR